MFSGNENNSNFAQHAVLSTEILDENQKPSEPYIVLGNLSFTKRNPPKTNLLISDLQEEAKKLGASALMNFKIESFKEEIYPIGFFLLDLANSTDSDNNNCCDDDNLSTVNANFKRAEAVAIRYINSIPYNNRIKASETYYSISDSLQELEMRQIRFSITGKRDDSGLFLTYDVSDILFLAENYSEYNLIENEDGWNTSEMGGKIRTRKKFRMNGEFLETKCNITYLRHAPKVKKIKITQYELVNYYTESIKYKHNKANATVSRVIDSKFQNFTENWIYDDSNRLKAVYFYKEGEHKPCLVRKTEYYSELEWNAYIKSITIYPENWKVKK